IEVRESGVPEIVEGIGPKTVELLQAAIENIDERLIRVSLEGGISVDVLQNLSRFRQKILVGQSRRHAYLQCKWTPRHWPRGPFLTSLLRVQPVDGPGTAHCNSCYDLKTINLEPAHEIRERTLGADRFHLSELGSERQCRGDTEEDRIRGTARVARGQQV